MCLNLQNYNAHMQYFHYKISYNQIHATYVRTYVRTYVACIYIPSKDVPVALVVLDYASSNSGVSVPCLLSCLPPESEGTGRSHQHSTETHPEAGLLNAVTLPTATRHLCSSPTCCHCPSPSCHRWEWQALPLHIPILYVYGLCVFIIVCSSAYGGS